MSKRDNREKMDRFKDFDLVLNIGNELDPEQRKRKIPNALALTELEYILRSGGVSWRMYRPPKSYITLHE